MKILSLVKREGGTVVDIPPRKYHFLPNENGDHVCDVDDKDHIKKFLAVDCYVLYEPGSSKDSLESENPAPDSPLSNDGDQGFQVVDEFEEDESDNSADHVQTEQADQDSDDAQQSEQKDQRELTPAQKRAQTIAAKKAEGSAGKPASTKPKANPALKKAE